MDGNTINREAGKQTKGFRLQKLRAVLLILEAIEKSDSGHIFFAIEHLEDVYIKSVNSSGTVEEYIEEDKNYESVSSFTINSNQVLNTLVSFIDCWIERSNSENLYFGFYNNVNIGKERETKRTKKLEITFPSEPIIELLMQKKYDENIINIVSKLLIDEYKEQYKGKTRQGYLKTIKKLKYKQWIDFLNCIRWKFSDKDEEELEDYLIEVIKSSELYRNGHEGKESLIISAIINNLEKKQKFDDLTEKLIHAAEVKLIFKEVEINEITRTDPSHYQWEKINNTDTRNLIDKVNSVCPDFSDDYMTSFARKVANIRLEYESFSNQRQMNSLKYQIFDACYDELIDLKLRADDNLKEKEIINWVDRLFKVAKNRISDKSKDYSYGLKNESSIKNVILELIDSCYLSFD